MLCLHPVYEVTISLAPSCVRMCVRCMYVRMGVFFCVFRMYECRNAHMSEASTHLKDLDKNRCVVWTVYTKTSAAVFNGL